MIAKPSGGADAAAAADDDLRVARARRRRSTPRRGSTTRGEPSSAGGERLDRRSGLVGRRATCGATERIRGEPCSRASSSRLPPQRWRVTTSPSIRGDVRRERLVEPRRDVREHLVAAVRAGRDDRVGSAGRGRRSPPPRRPARTAPSTRDGAHVAERRARTRAPAATARRRARRRRGRSRDTQLLHAPRRPRRRPPAPSPRISACLPWPSGHDEAQLLELRLGPRRARALRPACASRAARPGTDG